MGSNNATKKNDRNLVIKEGDKRGACAIMDKNYNKDNILSLLSPQKPTKKYTAPTLNKKY